MSGELKTTHEGIEIAYDEAKSMFVFELRGRERMSATLIDAKEAIDKEPAQKRKQQFPRFDAYNNNYRDDSFEVVTVTSIADPERYNNGMVRFWVSDRKGNRSKESSDSLYPVSEENTKIIKLWAEITARIRKLEKERSEIFKKAKTATVPKELE